MRSSCHKPYFLHKYTGLVSCGNVGFLGPIEAFMSTRILSGSAEKLKLPLGPMRQALGSSSSSRDKRNSVPVMVEGLQGLTSLKKIV